MQNGKTFRYNPSVTATPCHLPLHRGGIGWCVKQQFIALLTEADKHVHFSYAEADREIPVCLRFLLI